MFSTINEDTMSKETLHSPTENQLQGTVTLMDQETQSWAKKNWVWQPLPFSPLVFLIIQRIKTCLSVFFQSLSDSFPEFPQEEKLNALKQKYFFFLKSLSSRNSVTSTRMWQSPILHQGKLNLTVQLNSGFFFPADGQHWVLESEQLSSLLWSTVWPIVLY